MIKIAILITIIKIINVLNLSSSIIKNNTHFISPIIKIVLRNTFFHGIIALKVTMNLTKLMELYKKN